MTFATQRGLFYDIDKFKRVFYNEIVEISILLGKLSLAVRKIPNFNIRKEKNVKKVLLMLLVLCMILPMAVACGDNEGGTPSGTTAASGDPGSTNAPENYEDTIPERDYDLEEFHVLCTTQTEGFYNVTEDMKDPVSEAVFKRNDAVEERFNIVFKYTSMNGNSNGKEEFLTALSNSTTMGDDGFDLVVGQNYYCLPVAAEGKLQDLASSPYLHWDEKWYSQKINDSADINGRIFGASGSYIMSQISYAQAILYTKELFEGLYPDVDLYQKVRDMEWTRELLTEYATGRYLDNDGDHRPSDADDFGYVYNGHGVAAAVVASDVPIATVDENGDLTVLNYYNEHSEKVFTEYYRFFNQTQGVFKRSDDHGPAIMIGQGRTLFACAMLGSMHDCADLKNSELHFGVLPLPLFDSNQTEYFTHTMRWELFYIPVNADFERSAIILEHLNYQTEKFVIPAYWEEALTLRAADSDQDSEMMYLVRDALWYDFVTFFNFEVDMRDAIASQISNKSSRFTVWWNQNKDRLQTALENTLEKYGNVEIG